MIKKIDIKGFKSFDSVSLELNNFTLLAGRNSMGKTSVIQAVFCNAARMEIIHFVGSI